MTRGDPEARAKRQAKLALARRLRLLPTLERAAFWRERARRREENAAFAAAHPGVAMPPLRWMHDMYAHASYRLYWDSGREHAAAMARLIAAHLGPGRHCVAEWGCGMGRIVRHLTGPHEIAGFDYNPAAIRWCAGNLPGRYAQNGLMPPLPTPDASLDAVFAVSVLTHLSGPAHEAWIAELARVLRPGGIALLTVHGEPAPGQLLPEEADRFARGHFVERGRVKEGSRIYTAYQPDAFMRRLLVGVGFEVASDPEPAFGQTLWVARR